MSRPSNRVVRLRYGYMCTSFFGATRVTRIAWVAQYLRIPFAPCRLPSPEAYQPPIGSSRAK
jgi:hypothetical protein